MSVLEHVSAAIPSLIGLSSLCSSWGKSSRLVGFNFNKFIQLRDSIFKLTFNSAPFLSSPSLSFVLLFIFYKKNVIDFYRKINLLTYIIYNFSFSWLMILWFIFRFNKYFIINISLFIKQFVIILLLYSLKIFLRRNSSIEIILFLLLNFISSQYSILPQIFYALQHVSCWQFSVSL